MHRQAHEVLPALLQALEVRGPIWLMGHSDGGSIALLHAAQACAAPAREPTLAGLIVMAPHILVEEVSLRSIEQARQAYLQGGLREKLARHHADPDSAFWGWNRVWLDPAFAPWSIEGELSRIAVPVLAIQGLNDEYGTLEQIRGIARRTPQTELLELPDCGHSPHRDQPQALITAITQFFGRHSQRA
jgi:pimeloyl-ACP methyl ester carboxylesterase